MRRALTGLVLLAAAAPAVGQAVHKVPKDFATIQEAVTAAADGDTIEISGGTYDEEVVVTGKANLWIRGKGKVVIDPPTETGLTLDSCSGVRVEKIRVLGAAPFGFHLLDSTDCELVKCRVENSAEDGIRADGGGGHVIEKCTVKFAGNDGIALGAEEASFVDDCLVVKCKLLNVGGDGVDVNGSFNVVDGCLALKPFDDGYEVDGTTVGEGNSFNACKVIKPGFSGFIVTGTGTTLTACKAVQVGDFGAGIADGDGHLIQDCKFVKPGNDGILQDDPSTGAALDGNKVTAPGDDGLDIEGAGILATGNKVSGAGDNGYEITGTGGEYTGNSSTGSKDNGFFLSGTDNTLSLNKAKGSKGFDLFDDAPGDNEVAKDNDFGSVFP
jgi:hypothetical protein